MSLKAAIRHHGQAGNRHLGLEATQRIEYQPIVQIEIPPGPSSCTSRMQEAQAFPQEASGIDEAKNTTNTIKGSAVERKRMTRPSQAGSLTTRTHLEAFGCIISSSVIPSSGVRPAS